MFVSARSVELIELTSLSARCLLVQSSSIFWLMAMGDNLFPIQLGFTLVSRAIAIIRRALNLIQIESTPRQTGLHVRRRESMV